VSSSPTSSTASWSVGCTSRPDFPAGEDEFSWAGLGASDSVPVSPTRRGLPLRGWGARPVRSSRPGRRCSSWRRWSTSRWSRVWDQGRVDPERLAPVRQTGRARYAPLVGLVALLHPNWEQRHLWRR
jgi:hypothetical protein